jgi:outer membrane protein OmpA-like peptidoglycan-associated protein
VFPSISPTNGGAKITVNGANFKGSDGKIARIYVDGVLVKNVKVSADGMSISFVAPAHKLGAYSFSIKTKDGSTSYGITYVPGVKKLTRFILFSGDSAKILPEADKQLKSLSKILRGKSKLNIRVLGWVHRTSSTRIDAKLSEARAKATIKLLKKYGVKATFTRAAKGIYKKGDYTDRRAEIDAVWSE